MSNFAVLEDGTVYMKKGQIGDKVKINGYIESSQEGEKSTTLSECCQRVEAGLKIYELGQEKLKLINNMEKQCYLFQENTFFKPGEGVNSSYLIHSTEIGDKKKYYLINNKQEPRVDEVFLSSKPVADPEDDLTLNWEFGGWTREGLGFGIPIIDFQKLPDQETAVLEFKSPAISEEGYTEEDYTQIYEDPKDYEFVSLIVGKLSIINGLKKDYTDYSEQCYYKLALNFEKSKITQGKNEDNAQAKNALNATSTIIIGSNRPLHFFHRFPILYTNEDDVETGYALQVVSDPVVSVKCFEKSQYETKGYYYRIDIEPQVFRETFSINAKWYYYVVDGIELYFCAQDYQNKGKGLNFPFSIYIDSAQVEWR